MTSLLALKEGSKLGTTDWVTVSQAKIDAFAEVTGDHQWIHIDPERCASESPFKTTIAHGFLSATLLPSLFYPMLDIPADKYSMLNYGVDKIRFLEPVRVNDNIRYHLTLSTKQQKPTGLLFALDCEVEIENRDKPAMVGTFLTLLVEVA